MVNGINPWRTMGLDRMSGSELRVREKKPLSYVGPPEVGREIPLYEKTNSSYKGFLLGQDVRLDCPINHKTPYWGAIKLAQKEENEGLKRVSLWRGAYKMTLRLEWSSLIRGKQRVRSKSVQRKRVTGRNNANNQFEIGKRRNREIRTHKRSANRPERSTESSG